MVVVVGYILKDFTIYPLKKFMALKKFWKASMQSLIMKALSTHRMSDTFGKTAACPMWRLR
jgi:hypothetical protein